MKILVKPGPFGSPKSIITFEVETYGTISHVSAHVDGNKKCVTFKTTSDKTITVDFVTSYRSMTVGKMNFELKDVQCTKFTTNDERDKDMKFKIDDIISGNKISFNI